MKYSSRAKLDQLLKDLQFLQSDLRECSPARHPEGVQKKMWLRWVTTVENLAKNLDAVLQQEPSASVAPPPKRTDEAKKTTEETASK